MPIYAIEPANAMAFHSRYWDEPVVNDSAGYNLYQQIHRRSAAQHLKSDAPPLSRPAGKVEINPRLRLVPPVGGILMFSGAQMHSTVVASRASIGSR